MFGFWKGWLVTLVILFASALHGQTADVLLKKGWNPSSLSRYKTCYAVNYKMATYWVNGKEVTSEVLSFKIDRKLPVNTVVKFPSSLICGQANAKLSAAPRRRVSRPSTTTILRRQLTEEKNTSAALRSQNAELQKRADELPKLRSDLDRTQKEFDALRAANKGNIPWLWLLALGLIGAFTTAIAYHISATRTAERKEVEIGNLKADKKIQSDRAHEAEADLEIIHAKWDNPDALRLRLAELEKSLHHSSPP